MQRKSLLLASPIEYSFLLIPCRQERTYRIAFDFKNSVHLFNNVPLSQLFTSLMDDLKFDFIQLVLPHSSAIFNSCFTTAFGRLMLTQ